MNPLGKGPDAIGIVCTGGRRRHDPEEVGWVIEIGDRSPTGRGVEQLRRPDGWRTGYSLRCKRCRWEDRKTEGEWRRIVRKLDTARIRTLDISHLPD